MPRSMGQNLSPQERQHIALSTSSPGKCFRFEGERQPPPSHQRTPVEPVMLYSMHTNSSGESSDVPTIPALIQPTGNATAVAQMLAIAQETHAQRLALEDSMVSETGTQTVYARQLKGYEKWWISDQTRRREEDSTLEYISPHPITATKVALFLEFETARPKRSSGGGNATNLSSTRVGPSLIKQYYASDPSSQSQLRNDIRIRTYKRSAKASKPERMEKMQMMKINGVKTDTFGGVDELIKASMHYLQNPESSTPYKVHLGIRDRAMFLLPTAMAFRGDNTHISLTFTAKLYFRTREKKTSKADMIIKALFTTELSRIVRLDHLLFTFSVSSILWAPEI
ncbi:hypothetical protein HYPSUDRAFT_59992 [Hypholoma sublateritium FD-334 SS-4]|uniref:Uncharacterized protein n=1 Tax=Hypholoma sublateritium (strain FD-334 SS-4) TaxID=945553 RepID=A0A0D2KFS0_HYPSF|nr:hypothetical protein HYPSUDRAFT_59992 [Hypholoma sublateritium FD-334 SS-4]